MKTLSLKKLTIRFGRYLLGTLFLLNVTGSVHAQQLLECDGSVPYFIVDLSSNPDSMYVTPEIIRNGQCCSGSGNENYVSFYVTLHPEVAMIEIGIMPGYADPYGSGFYNIIPGDTTTLDPCGTEYAGGSPTCITGSGPHKITYHKPGKNKVKYYVKQIPRPIYPQDDTTRIGCSLPLAIYGLDNITMTSINSSTGNTTPGAYDNLLGCTGCSTPSFNPGLGTPLWIDYQICGDQQASIVCGTYQTCDTVRLYSMQPLTLTATPNPASFCIGDSVYIYGTGGGGDGNFSYVWYDNLDTVVSNVYDYYASVQGSYTLELLDGLVTPTCPSKTIPVTVIQGSIPVVNAGSDKTVCATDPEISLLGILTNAEEGTWSGGSGTFDPSPDSLITSYMPTQAEIDSGFVELILTTTDAGNGCDNNSDTVVIYFSDTVKVNPSFTPLSCYGETTTIFANASGGMGPYTYMWTNGSPNSSISAPAGLYGVVATDSIGCYSTMGYASVSEPAPLVLSMGSSNTSTDLACDGTAWVEVAGGTGPYTYLWSNFETNDTTTNTLCWGIATVVVTDANGCTINGSVVVNKPSCSSFDVTATNTDVLCYGDSNAVALAIASGGTGPYQYVWNTTPPQNTPNASNLEAGTYTVTAIDADTCIDVFSVTVFQPTLLTNYMTHTDVTWLTGNDGTATANPQGGTPGYSYTWSPAPAAPQTTQTVNNLTAGIYYVDILDTNSCLVQDSVMINEPPCNDFIIAVNPKNITCNGFTNGSAYLTISQGSAPFSISWSSGQNDVMNVNGLGAGSYSVSVTDDNGCTTFTSFNIAEPDTLTFGLVPTNVSCNGLTDGTIDLNVSGGVFPYTYQWYKGASSFAESEDLVGIGVGTYSVIVTDANGCSVSGSVGITQPAVLGASYLYTDVVCNGNDDGTVDATITGGVMPYAYSWTGPSGYTNNTQDLSGLSPGLYQLQVTDANGCTLSTQMQAYINEPDPVVIETWSVPCPAPGVSSTTVTIDSISGGSGEPYAVSFNGGSSYLTEGVYSTSLATGNSYQVLAMDDNGCTTPDTVTIVIDSNVVITAVDFDPCVSVGVSNIDITVTAQGGTGGSYEVSTNGGSTFNAPGTYVISLAVGTSYNIVVRDSNGCLSTVWPIVLPAPFDANAILTAEVSCPGESDGSVNLTVTGGTSPFTYSWTGPGGFTASTEDISGLIAGTYDVTVTDDSSCVVSTSILVTTTPDVTPPTIITCGMGAQNETSDPGQCYYTNTGTAWDAAASDNCLVASIVYTLSGATVGTGTSLNGVTFNLGTTLVTWTVTDGSGNTSTCSFNIVVSDEEDPQISSCGASGTQNVVVDNGVCYYSNTGTGWDATADDNCTVSTLTYTLTGATTGSGTSLDGVQFSLGNTLVTWTVTDQSGNTDVCSFAVSVTDDQDPAIVTCGPGSNQTVPADNGLCTYTHAGTAWNATASDNCTVSTIYYTLTGATTGVGSTLNGITFNSGTTTVTWTAVDNSGNTDVCSFTVTVTDDQDPAITTCGPSGNQTVNANLGTCTYTYNGTGWNAVATDNCTVSTLTYVLSGATTGTGSSLSGVTFNLGTTTVTWTATDAAGNTATCSFNVTVLDDQDPTIVTCGASGTQNVGTDNGVCTFTQTGTGWDAIGADNCSVSTTTYVLTGATSGSGTSLSGVTFNQGTTLVTWTVTDGSGNTATCSFNVVVADDENPVISGCPSNITVSNNNGNCGAIVTWSAPSFTDNCGASMTSTHNSGDFFPIGTTTVTYTVTDNAGNVSVCTFTVTVNDTELPQLSCQSNVESCNPVVTFTTPTASDNCGVATLTQIAGLPSGSTFPVGTTTITYQAIDIYGNANTCSFDVIIHPTPVLSTVATDITCFGLGDGSIDLSVSNGTSPFTYDWSNGATTQDVSGLAEGIYYVTVTDAFGCSATTNATIDEPAQLSFSKQVTQVSCYGFTDGAVNITVGGGIQPYTYNWSNGVTTEDINGLGVGNYSVSVNDANGCSLSNLTVIVQPDSLEINTSVTPATCNAPNGSIQVQVVGGTTPYNYNWSNGSTTANLNNVVSGTYSLIVTDDNGCVLNYSDSIAAISTLTAEVYLSDALCYGDSTGSAVVDVETGTAPYSYSWSNGDTGTKADELAAGNYTVTVTDAFGCVFGYDFVIGQPDSLYVDLYAYTYGTGYNVSTYGSQDGSIEAVAGGGIPPYDYDWGDYGNGSYITGLGAGSYTVIVTDDNGCVVTAGARLIGPDVLEMPEGLTPNGDGDNDYFVVHGLDAYPENDITIFNRWGNVVYETKGYDQMWQGQNMKDEPLPDGTYYVILNAYLPDGSKVTLTGYVDLRRN